VIVKELDPFQSEDKLAKSGRAAEEQMAFYLKRFFATDSDVLVLNGVRLEEDGDAAQIDHLLIHSYGLTIVESKSVHGKIQIKDDGQWIRWFGTNQSKGIASPLTQARLQERFFRKALGTAAKNPAFFDKLTIDTYIAISDSGVILWPKSGPVDNVCKADQIADKVIESNVSRARQMIEPALSEENRKKIAAFLLAKNKPLVKQPSEPEVDETTAVTETASTPSIPATEAPANCCKHCGSHKLEIRYSFSYFFYCNRWQVLFCSDVMLPSAQYASPFSRIRRW
jgi:hypothetical protein